MPSPESIGLKPEERLATFSTAKSRTRCPVATNRSHPLRTAMPSDWIESAAQATHQAINDAGLSPDQIFGVGVDFTSCTMLPTKRDGKPLCEVESFAKTPRAWLKLWKHHGAIEQTDVTASLIDIDPTLAEMCDLRRFVFQMVHRRMSSVPTMPPLLNFISNGWLSTASTALSCSDSFTKNGFTRFADRLT